MYSRYAPSLFGINHVPSDYCGKIHNKQAAPSSSNDADTILLLFQILCYIDHILYCVTGNSPISLYIYPHRHAPVSFAYLERLYPNQHNALYMIH